MLEALTSADEELSDDVKENVYLRQPHGTR